LVFGNLKLLTGNLGRRSCGKLDTDAYIMMPKRRMII